MGEISLRNFIRAMTSSSLYPHFTRYAMLTWGTVIVGTGIVLGGNSSKLKALQENLASFEMMTEWVDAPDVPPPHAFITAF